MRYDFTPVIIITIPNSLVIPSTHSHTAIFKMDMIFLMCYWILIARILLRSFASMFISDVGLWFSFLWHLC